MGAANQIHRSPLTIITGATGFLGGHLAAALVGEGRQVVALVRRGSDTESLLRRIGNPRFLSIIEIPDDPTALVNLVKEIAPDTIFHIAARSQMEHEAADIVELINSNLRLGTLLLEGIRSTVLKRTNSALQTPVFLCASSFWQHANGQPTYNPNSLYAATKQAFEDIALYYMEVEKLPVVALKLFDVYGEDDTRERILQILVKASKSNQKVPLSPGEQVVDFIHVDDVVNGFLHAERLLRERPESLDLSYTLPGPSPMKLKSIIKTIEYELGCTVPVEWGGRPYRTKEVMNPFRDNVLPGWKAHISFSQGIRRLADSIKR